VPSYEQIKARAEALGVSYKHLIVLSKNNDPFYVGRDRDLAMAEWFANAWEEHGFLGRGGVHLRRAHYQLLGSPKHDGLPYQNTEGNYNYLIDAARYARILLNEDGEPLVNPEDIIDRRNPEPHIYLSPPAFEEEPGYELGDLPDLSLPSISGGYARSLETSYLPDLEPDIRLRGYDYDDYYQPYHVEVWAEKSTMNDILRPLCRRSSVNLVTGLGYLSITAIVALLRRIEQTGKPARILYVSDLDKAGKNMPRQVARQCEFWLRKYLPDADIRLQPIILTPAQVDEHELWEKAIRNEETGEETYELDALEGLRPGRLARIVRENIREFRDLELPHKYALAEHRAQEVVEDALRDALGPHLETLAEIRQAAKPILERYDERLAPIAAQVEAELAPLRERLNEVQQAIMGSVTDLEIDLPDLPEPDEGDPDDEDWLFDTRRGYWEQFERYKTPEELAQMEAEIRSKYKTCPYCGAAFRAKTTRRMYCSNSCRSQAGKKKREAAA
jgi:hypothetical protein